MKIMVTGANGFLGSHLVRHFHKNGHKLLTVSLHTNKISDLVEDINFYYCSMNRITSLGDSIAAFSPEVIIHCAWSGGNSFRDTQSSVQFYKNLPGLADLMEIMEKHKLPRFVGIGSGAEYGNNLECMLEHDREEPTNLYGVCKYMAKLYTQQFVVSRGIKWNWIRPFYTYGPDDVSTRLIPSVIYKCLGKEEVLLDSCNTIVDYLYIDDFVTAVDSLISSQYEGVFNICSGQECSVKNVVTKIGEMTGNIDKIRFGAIPERKGGPDKILGDSKKLNLFTNWRPNVSLDDGLQKTIAFYKKV